MELFNYGEGQVSVEKQTYAAIRNSVDFSYDEFMSMNDNERNEWIDACRVALLLIEEKEKILYDGYSNTNMFDSNGNFNLGNATCIVHRKKRMLDMIEKHTDIDFTLAQFILFGENGTKEVVNDCLRSLNQETARTLDEGRVKEYIQIKDEIEKLVFESESDYIEIL